jgi:hypothetical protein
MKIYEVICYGCDHDPDGPDGKDTIFLVRAKNFKEAVDFIELNYLPSVPHEFVNDFVNEVHEIGEDLSDINETEKLRGPYFENAFNRGWKSWNRIDKEDPWEVTEQ